MRSGSMGGGQVINSQTALLVIAVNSVDLLDVQAPIPVEAIQIPH